jgi:PPK2 family polyphosphate:nucleotide phosphotransferase
MSSHEHVNHRPYTVAAGTKVALKKFSTKAGPEFARKSDARKALKEDISALAEAQRILWASEEFSVLILFQAMDAAGKDGTIRHVMSGVNPQGCSVQSFKAPTEEELRHHFLWRPTQHLPGRGRIGIFNRSYYEEVLVVRVHPEYLKPQRLPQLDKEQDLWQLRFETINDFEKGLHRHGTLVLKFFLHLSKGEQKKRFLERIDDPTKNWKFTNADLRDRGFWDQYQAAYEEMLSHTSTRVAPWYVIPADQKWFARALVADIITSRIKELPLKPPSVSKAQQKVLQESRAALEAEE